MPERQKVYVLRRGEYSQQYVQGVYTTPEAAMMACPVPAKCREGDVRGHVCGWHEVRREDKGALPRKWAMDCDWAGADLDEYELDA